jgi:hypothetical protein
MVMIKANGIGHPQFGTNLSISFCIIDVDNLTLCEYESCDIIYWR